MLLQGVSEHFGRRIGYGTKLMFDDTGVKTMCNKRRVLTKQIATLVDLK